MEFGREYEETEAPDPPDDGYVEDIDTGPMTADTAEPETPETIANQMMEDVLARSGLERPDYGSVAPAPETETPEPVIEPVAAPPEPVSEPVATAVEQNERSGAELKPVEIIMINGRRYAASGISSGIVYEDYASITPEIVQENLDYVERLRAKFREQGEPASDHEQELIATAQEALLKYAETLGVDVADRMPPLGQYIFHNRSGELDATSLEATKTEIIAHAKLGIGVGVARDALPEDPIDRLHVIAHETAHMLHLMAIESRMRARGGFRLNSMPYVARDSLGNWRTGLYEAITELHVHRSLDNGHCQRIGDGYQIGGNWGPCAILSGIITKYAGEHGIDPNTIADEIVKGALTGDMSVMNRLVAPFGDKKNFIFGLREAEQPTRTAAIAHALDLQDTQSIFDKWRNDELSRFRGAYNW